MAALSGNNRRGVTAESMSAAVGLKGGTGGLNSRFFRTAGWFDGVGRGEYTASPGLLQYVRHTSVAPDDTFAATSLMREEVKQSWFWEVLEPMLASGQPVKATVALLQLANTANATSHATSSRRSSTGCRGWVSSFVTARPSS